MSDDNDHERIARKAHEIWESEGHPHGRDQTHWDQAKEIIALHDSMGDTLLPRDTGSSEPEGPALSVESNGDIPGLTDQGRDDLVDTDREPEITKPSHTAPPDGGTANTDLAAPQAIVPKGASPETTSSPSTPSAVTGPGMEKGPILSGVAPAAITRAPAAPPVGASPASIAKPAPKPVVKAQTPPAKGKPQGKR